MICGITNLKNQSFLVSKNVEIRSSPKERMLNPQKFSSKEIWPSSTRSIPHISFNPTYLNMSSCTALSLWKNYFLCKQEHRLSCKFFKKNQESSSSPIPFGIIWWNLEKSRHSPAIPRSFWNPYLATPSSFDSKWWLVCS